MFEVLAKNDFVVSSMDIHTSSVEFVDVEVWTKADTMDHISYDNGNEWKKVLSVKVLGKGLNQATTLPGFTNYIEMSANRVRSFYVTLKTRQMIFSRGSTLGKEYVSNTDVGIKTGILRTYLFGESHSPWDWDGRIHYITR